MNNPWEVQGRAVQKLSLELPRTGAWTARVSVYGDEPLPANVTLACQNGGGPFVGHVSQQTSDRGYVIAQLVGGAGKLNKAVSARGYKNTTSAIVARELATEAGELFAANSTASASLAFYARFASTLSDTLTVLSASTGEPWRITNAGAVFVGELPAAAHTSSAYFLSRDESSNSEMYALDYPEFEPSQTFDGKTIASVVYDLNGSLRAAVYYR